MCENTSRCIVDGAKGIYVGQDFALRFDMREWGVSETDENILLEGPACPMTGTPSVSYWDVWAEVLDTAVYHDEKGDEWVLEQDGDLFMRNLDAEQDEDFSHLDDLNEILEDTYPD